MRDKKELKRQAKEIEDFLNEAAKKINEEAGVVLFPYKAKVVLEDNK